MAQPYEKSVQLKLKFPAGASTLSDAVPALPVQCGEGSSNLFPLHRLFQRLIDQCLVPSGTGLGLEEGDYPGTQHDIDPLFAESILKAHAEPGAVKIGLGDNGGVIRGFRRRFFVHFFPFLVKIIWIKDFRSAAPA